MSAQASASSGVKTLTEDIVQVAVSSGVGRRLTCEQNASTDIAVIKVFRDSGQAELAGYGLRGYPDEGEFSPLILDTVQIHLTDYLYSEAVSS